MTPVRAKEIRSQILATQAAREVKRRLKPKRKLAIIGFRPHKAVILAVDPGAESGWAISVCGEIKHSGQVALFDSFNLARICTLALFTAQDAGIPCVLVIEKPYGGSAATLIGMGAARGAWKNAWAANGGPKNGKTVLVATATYRSKVLGRGMGNADRKTGRAMELAYAKRVLSKAIIGTDEAAAVCIAVWAANASEVAARFGAKWRWAA